MYHFIFCLLVFIASPLIIILFYLVFIVKKEEGKKKKVSQVSSWKTLNDPFFCFFAATRAEVDPDIALYIGLAVALAVFTFLVIFIYRLLRRKGRDHSMYNMAVSGKWKRNKNCSLDLKSGYHQVYVKTGVGGGGGVQKKMDTPPFATFSLK